MNFGFYKDYLVMDAWGSGASHNRRMYLYRLGDKKVELLDTIGITYGYLPGWDFMSVYKSKFRSSEESGYSGLIEAADIDHDNRPELKLKIYMISSSAENLWSISNFNIYLEIRDDRLMVDFNPELYRLLFDKEKQSASKKKSDAYYIYGFLAGELKLEEIRRTFHDNKDRYEDIVPILEIAGKWDHGWHVMEKPELLRYDLKEAVCNE